MIAGRMRTRLIIYEATRTVNDYGSETTSYTAWKTIKAERVKTSAGRSEEVGEHFPEHRAEFRIRYPLAVCENWRCQEINGSLYTITAIIPDLAKGMKTLICDKVNE